MIIAVASDFHFGFNEDAVIQAREALLDAKRRGADAVLAPGDLFDFRVPKQEVLYEATRVFQEAKGAGGGAVTQRFSDGELEIGRPDNPVVAIYGTHERRAKGLSNVIELFHAAGLLTNVHSRKVILEKAVGPSLEKVCVQGMGGVPEEMAAQAVKLMDFKPVPGAFNIFMFHQSVRELIPQDESAMTMRDLPERFDLYVNGHIHWRQEFREAGRHLIIPGSTVVTQMKAAEANPKGYYFYDTQTRTLQFVEIKSRPFYHKELEFKQASVQQVLEQAAKAVDEIIAKNDSVKPLVKLKLCGTLAQGLSAAAVDLVPLQAKYGERMLLHAEKQLGALEFKEKIEFLRRMREEKKSASEMAKEILKRKLREKNAGDEELPKNSEEELFELLGEGETEKALALVLK